MPTPDFVLRLRAAVGHEMLWMPGVTAVVTDDDGRLLLVRRADNGAWTPVTGIVDPGEEPAGAAVREVLEEAGVVVVAERLASVGVTDVVTYPNGDVSQYLDLTFTCRHRSGAPHPADGENTDARWFDADDLPPMSAEMHQRVAAATSGEVAARFTR